MAAVVRSETYDALWTLSMRAKRKRLTDNISDGYPTVGKFRSSGVMETESGGKQIQEDLMYALASAEWFDDYDVLATDRLDGITAAFYDWSYLACPIVISMTEQNENRSSDKAISLLEAKTRQAMQGALDQVNASLLGSNSSNSKQIIGLQDIVSTSSGQTVGGIDSSSEAWWDNDRVDGGSTGFLATNGTTVDGIVNLGSAWNNISEGNDQPNLILTSYGLYGNYETLFEGGTYLRTTTNSKNNVDGRSPAFRGAAFVPDRDCASTSIYLLNTKYLKLKMQKGMNFAKTPFKEPANQMAKASFVVVGAQLTTNHRARQSVIYNQAVS